MKPRPLPSYAGDSYYLELSLDGKAHKFELGSMESRAVTVGSLPGVDLHIDRPGVAPVHFHLERDGASVWIVPAYGSGDLRLHGVPVNGPCALTTHGVIEFANLELIVSVNSPLSTGSTGSIRANDGSGMSDLAETIRLQRFAASERVVPESLQGSPRVMQEQHTRPPHPLTQRIPVPHGPIAPPRVAKLSSTLPLVYKPVIVEAHRIIPILRGPLPDLPITGRTRQSSMRTVSAREQPSGDRSVGAELSNSNQNTTVIDAPLAMVPRLGWLERIGTFGQAHPWWVWGFGSSCAFALSAMLTVALKHGPPSRPTVATRAAHSAPQQSRPAPSSTSKTPPGAASATSHPRVAVPQTRTTLSESTASNPEVGRAVGHLMAGRYGDAEQAYATLCAHQCEPALSALQRILQRRRELGCRESAAGNCPEIKP